MPSKVKEMEVTPKSVSGVKKMPMPGAEKKIKLKDITYQVILIIDGPEKINGKWELCDGCPDAMYYKGKLVPSCLLERVKEGENISIN